MRISFLFLLVFLPFSGFSQIETGYYTDTQGNPIDGYLDVPEYSNAKSLVHNEYSNGSMWGYYYDESGDKRSGDIMLKNRKAILYLNGDPFAKEKLKPDRIFSFVIGVDSFYSTYNFRVEGLLFSEKNPRYVKHYCSSNQYDFAIHYGFTRGQVIPTYLLRPIGEDYWVSPPESKADFRRYLMKYFSQIPGVEQLVTSKKLTKDDVPLLMFNSVIYDKFLAGESFYLDEWWNNKVNKIKGPIEGRIIEVDSVWTISYYKNGIKVHDSQTTPINPKNKSSSLEFVFWPTMHWRPADALDDSNWKEGFSKWYYPSGQLRKEARFVDNELKEVKVFYQNGELHYHYGIETRTEETKPLMNKGRFTANREKEIELLKYYYVASSEGINLLDKGGSGKEELNDKHNDRIVYRTYEKGVLKESYYVEEGKKIYQWLGQEYDVAPIQRKWDRDASEMYFSASLRKNISGKVAIAITIDPETNYQSVKMYGSLGPELDAQITKFFDKYEDLGNLFSINYESFKKGGEKVKYEVMIPFTFYSRRFTNVPSVNHWYHYPYMDPVFNPAMNFTLPEPPPIPNFPRY